MMAEGERAAPTCWLQRMQVQKCTANEEVASGELPATNQQSWVSIYSSFIYFFPVLPRIIWSFLFCSVMCSASQLVSISLSRILISWTVKKTFYEIYSTLIKPPMWCYLLVEIPLHTKGIKAQICFMTIITFLGDVCEGQNIFLTYLMHPLTVASQTTNIE